MSMHFSTEIVIEVRIEINITQWQGKIRLHQRIKYDNAAGKEGTLRKNQV